MSTATAYNEFVHTEVVNEEEVQTRVKTAQKKEENKLNTWKVYLPMGLFIGSLCAAFYASVVGSGTVAIVSIVAFLVAIGLSIYLAKQTINELIN